MDIPSAKYLSEDEFKKQFGPLFNSIFNLEFILIDPKRTVEIAPSGTPFKHKEWRIVLLPNGEMKFEEIDLLALIQAAQIIGDKEMIILNLDVPDQAVIRLDYEMIYNARYSSFGGFDSYLFGPSGMWGCASFWDHFFFLGGKQEFMDVFIRKAGGEEALKERFLEFANTSWPAMLGSKHGQGNRSEVQTFLNEILRRVGWGNKFQDK